MRRERAADAFVHLLGLSLAVVGATVAVTFSALLSRGEVVAGVVIYAALLIFGLAASAIYHMVPQSRLKAVLRRIDHAAIFLKIAGTYTPIVVLVGSGFAYSLLGLVWFVALGGAIMKLAFWRVPGRIDLMLYLGLGWAAVFLLPLVATTLPTTATVLIVAGGLMYSAGVIVFANWDRLRYSGALWHGIVLGASSCFFAAIMLAVFGSHA